MVGGSDREGIFAVLENQSNYIIDRVYRLVDPVSFQLLDEVGPLVIDMNFLLGRLLTLLPLLSDDLATLLALFFVRRGAKRGRSRWFCAQRSVRLTLFHDF